jgi:cytoskeletal protein RodZ
VPEKNITESPSLESLGQFLLDEREKFGLTRSELASRTKIAIDQISRMEEGHFSHLPPVYARGFLKTIAWALNLDPETVLSEYRRLSGHKENDPTSTLQPKKYMDADILDDSSSNLGLTLFLVFVIVIAGVFFYFFNPSFQKLVVGYLPFLQQSQADDPETAIPVSGGPAPAVAPPQAGGRLVLRADKVTWSQIMVDDEALKFVYFQPGQSQTFDSQKSITVMVGDGQALKAEWNGQDLGFLGPRGPLELVFPLVR